jgi:hypothetical protein
VVNKYIVTGALIALTGSGAIISAQAPTQAPGAPAPQAPKASVAEKTATTTVVGCVYREKDVPGRAPNVAERAGVLEDYILAEMPSSPIASGRAPDSTATSTPGAPPSAVGTSGAARAMYKLEFVDDDKLKSMVGKRVEVIGRIDVEAGDSVAPAAGTKTTTTDKVIGKDRVDLSEFEVSSIKEVAGACPATPAP